jgi:hypothetical protein
MCANSEEKGRGWQARAWVLWATRLLILGCVPASCVAATASASQTFSAYFLPIGKLQVNASLPLIGSGTLFAAFSGGTSVNYRIRTSASGGGTITAKASSDFSPAGGPTITANVLSYTCSGATLGTACSGQQTVSTTAQTPVATIPSAACTGGGGACSASNPNSVSLSFVLVNDPQYQTGTFSAVLTFTISAT